MSNLQAQLMTPAERADAIAQLDREISVFDRADCWKRRYDGDPEQEKHRAQLTRLIDAMEARIVELQGE